MKKSRARPSNALHVQPLRKKPAQELVIVVTIFWVIPPGRMMRASRARLACFRHTAYQPEA
jgi:hypothetical protein